MLGAIYTGLSGMNAYSDGLMMISNNVANLNTPGYKSNLISFNDLFGQGSGFLGSNASQAGYGVSMGSSFIDFSQGQMQQSSNPLDLAIQGNGFLTLLNGGNTYYARTGSFFVDQDGYISDAQGNHLAVLNTDGTTSAFNVNPFQVSAPAASTDITFSGNLSSDQTDTPVTVASIKVFDSLGTAHQWTVTFTKATDGSNTWAAAVTDETGATVGSGTVGFNADGTIDPANSKFTVTPQDGSGLSVTLDFSTGVTSYSGGTTSTLAASNVDGNAMGTLTAVGVSKEGKIELAYSNGKTVDEGFVALASFQDTQQLHRVGSGLYRAPDGVHAQLLASGADGIGTLQSGQIEASNVNLSDEFGQLILIERGFQACSQVVSVSNDMIQTLFGMRGQ